MSKFMILLEKNIRLNRINYYTYENIFISLVYFIFFEIIIIIKLI